MHVMFVSCLLEGNPSIDFNISAPIEWPLVIFTFSLNMSCECTAGRGVSIGTSSSGAETPVTLPRASILTLE